MEYLFYYLLAVNIIACFFYEALKRNRQGCRSATGHIEVCPFDTGIIRFIHIISQALPYFRITRCRCIAIDFYRGARIQKIDDRFFYTIRCRYGRVANTKIEYVFFTDNFGLFLSIIKQRTDGRTFIT